MSRSLERRLTRAFDELPGPDPEVEERARRAVLATVGPAPRRRRRAFRIAAVALLGAAIPAVAALGLGAAGTIHLRVGGRTAGATSTPVAAAAPHLVVPRGARGISAVVDGRLWLATRRGLRIEGLPVSSAALSPHALYVAVGLGRSLVAMAPNRRHAWSHPAGGTVVAAAWSPDGLRIAYVVRRGAAYQLRSIEGDGDTDRLVDARVRPVRPSWRADSLALVYVGAGGRPVVYDLGHHSWHVVPEGSCAATGPARAVAFAPAGRALAFVTTTSVFVTRAHGVRCLAFEGVLGFTGLAWTSPRSLVTGEAPTVDAPAYLRRFTSTLSGGGAVRAGAAVAGLAAVPGGADLVLARTGTGGGLNLSLARPRVNGSASLHATRLLRLEAGPVTALDIR